MDINKEYQDIDNIMKGHKPVEVVKDFYDKLLLNEDFGRGIWDFGDWKYDDLIKADKAIIALDQFGIGVDDGVVNELRSEIAKRKLKANTGKGVDEEVGRVMDEAPEKDIHVTVKIPMDKLMQIKVAVEKENQGRIHDLPLLATEVVNNLVWQYFNPDSIDATNFIDLTVRDEIDVDETVLATSGEPTSNIDVTPIKEKKSKSSLINVSYYENGKYLEDIPLDVKELEDGEEMEAQDILKLNPREEDIGKKFYRVGENIYAVDKGE